MKILQLLRNQCGAVSFPPELVHFPASTLLQPGKPFFVPGFSAEWEARPIVALRVCRLGKNIDERFASRYIDAIAPGVRFIPVDLDSRPELQGLVTTIDSSVAIGPWQPLPEIDSEVALGWRGAEITFTLRQLRIPAVVAALSSFMMLQMGDVILPCTFPVGCPVKENDEINVRLSASEAYTVRIK